MSEDRIKTPLEAFVDWFERVPLHLRRYLAHNFTLCTTEDATLMAADSGRSLEGFQRWVKGSDFPLRVAARMFYIRAVFDMMILHHKEMGPAMYIKNTPDGVIDLSGRQWEDVLNSWRALRANEMSEPYIHSWASWMIKLQTEAV